MQLWQLGALVGAITVVAAIFVWALLRPIDPKQSNPGHKGHNKKDKPPTSGNQIYTETAEHEIEHIFNNEFREELRNRGRLHFEKIIGENAMFLQQDLRLTTAQLNDYMKQEISRTLREEFAKYQESIVDAKQLAIESIQKTQEAIEQQRQILGEQLHKELEMEKNRLLERFEKNMADIINHYLLSAIGDQIDLSDQLEYILADLEANKQAIVEDITYGA